MNLYKLHSDPESLHKHDEAQEIVPKLFWEKYKNNPEELKKREDAIAKDASYSYLYATGILKAPFPKGEDSISKNAEYSHLYARDVLDGSWPKGEDSISKYPYYSYYYARDVLKGPFPKGEDTIFNSDYADDYRNLIKDLDKIK